LQQAQRALTSAAERVPELDRLASGAAAGDELAFAQLVRAVRPQLYRWALVQAVDPDDAEDITQDALLRLHRSLAGFRFGARVSTWLYTLVRSAAADWRRAAKRRLARQHSYATSQPASAPDPGSAGVSDLLRLVREQLGVLPARQREVFDLAELQGRPTAEVGELLGLSESTVRVHLLRARRAIRARVFARSEKRERGW
jgi:RNA polymerase sigma-70 factor (ECF subfamily)